MADLPANSLFRQACLDYLAVQLIVDPNKVPVGTYKGTTGLPASYGIGGQRFRVEEVEARRDQLIAGPPAPKAPKPEPVRKTEEPERRYTKG